MYFNPSDTHITNEVGMPVRQDVCIVLSYKSGNNSNDRSINQGDDTQEIVKTYGYIDFQWVGPSNVGYAQNTQKFVPNFIITRIESSVIPTPDITLLAITSILAICEDMNWMQAFRSVPTKKGEVDFNDIGALNLEGNIEANTQGFGAKIDTKSKEFTLTMLNTLVNQLVTPNLVISIDVAQASPDTWFENVFYYASRGDTEGANNRILTSIKNMSCGILDINPNISIFSPIINKVHGGYYKTKDGIKDLRQLTSYLGVANFAAATGQDPKIVSEYTNSFFMTSVPTDLRATERKKFIDNMSNNTAVYKQFYTRLTFNSGFISALLESLRRVGFAPVFGNLMTSNDMFYRRATGDFSSAIIGGDVRVISNTQNYSGTYQPNMYTRQY